MITIKIDDVLCAGKLVVVLEGGYNEDMTAQCVDAVVKVSNVP
jgi:acetoin utilization deacetylase AcuC-like enzyme